MSMRLAHPEPPSTADPRELLLGYLDFYRDQAVEKCTGLTPEQLHATLLPSGWTPAGLLTHLAFMERRWLRWGFLAEQVDEPWGDHVGGQKGDGWVPRDADLPALAQRLRDGGRRTREIVEAHALTAAAAAGGRFETAEGAPHLQWILLHVLQEYARHVGHLDIVRELHDAP